MGTVSRRTFLASGAGCVAVGAGASRAPAATRARAEQPTPIVRFFGDGLYLSPAEYADLLARLAQSGKAKADVYLNGGAVQELETRLAKELGKERAVFIPTGTLANHLALRRLGGDRSRVIVQAESHIY